MKKPVTVTRTARASETTRMAVSVVVCDGTDDTDSAGIEAM